MNSLFYNLNEDAVEDLTGQGLEDLRQGLLRTPLPPQETFKDGEQHGRTISFAVDTSTWLSFFDNSII